MQGKTSVEKFIFRSFCWRRREFYGTLNMIPSFQNRKQSFEEEVFL